ncbi:hypothetical protein LSH36_306g03013 [Paralvinella palmiformis]|uniref:Uncharacterized protein n=1 Tax=Paralvinella palmiformis TaxID=53620 RepID=A0AAD9JH88_9ANNE|nr:hypothetical protein LSH36_306g03013 [Paralvinella palmiformis]
MMCEKNASARISVRRRGERDTKTRDDKSAKAEKEREREKRKAFAVCPSSSQLDRELFSSFEIVFQKV